MAMLCALRSVLCVLWLFLCAAGGGLVTDRGDALMVEQVV